MNPTESYTVTEELEGVRLDKVLAELLPDSGLRLRRRYCDDGRVLVNDKKCKPGYKVRAGSVIQIIQDEGNAMSFQKMGLSVVKKAGLFAAIYKPGGIHSAAIQGKDSPSVEAVLPEVFEDTTPILLNRLDCLTSGLLLVALNKDAENAYHRAESRGEIKKFYVANVKGRVDGFATVKSGLDTDDRKKTRVLNDDDHDALRWTDIEALSHNHNNDTSMVKCLIMKGARHQIRAHLASIGHPIIGDPLYGDGEEGQVLELHHQRIDFPGFSAEIKAPF